MHVFLQLKRRTTPGHVQEQQNALITSIKYERGMFPEGKNAIRKCFDDDYLKEDISKMNFFAERFHLLHVAPLFPQIIQP